MINSLPKVKLHVRKTLGRGYGSGKGGHTSGRGQKGQKARRTMGILFEGVKMKKSLIKRLPFVRGKTKFKSRKKTAIFNLSFFKDFKDGSEVTLESLRKMGALGKKKNLYRGVKILGSGKIATKLKFSLPMSKLASEKVVKAGGEVH